MISPETMPILAQTFVAISCVLSVCVAVAIYGLRPANVDYRSRVYFQVSLCLLLVRDFDIIRNGYRPELWGLAVKISFAISLAWLLASVIKSAMAERVARKVQKDLYG